MVSRIVEQLPVDSRHFARVRYMYKNITHQVLMSKKRVASDDQQLLDRERETDAKEDFQQYV